MSQFTCPNCGYYVDIFAAGGGQREAEQLGVHFLGTLPLELEIRQAADIGSPIVLKNFQTATTKACRAMVDKICRMLGEG